MDAFVASAIVLSFATLMTAHVALAVGLAARRPRWRGVVALVVVPLAPYWGFREKMRVRTLVWTLALATYATVFVVSRMAG